MSKDHDTHKETKKQPMMTLKEKRAAKKAKHETHTTVSPVAGK